MIAHQLWVVTRLRPPDERRHPVGPDKDIKSLGFTNDLRNSGKHQVKRIEKMGNEWVTNMNTSRYLRRGDVRLSLSSQVVQN